MQQFRSARRRLGMRTTDSQVVNDLQCVARNLFSPKPSFLCQSLTDLERRGARGARHMSPQGHHKKKRLVMERNGVKSGTQGRY